MRPRRIPLVLAISVLLLFGVGKAVAIADNDPPSPVTAADCQSEGDDEDAFEAADDVADAANEVAVEAAAALEDDESGDLQGASDESHEQDEVDCESVADTADGPADTADDPADDDDDHDEVESDD